MSNVLDVISNKFFFSSFFTFLSFDAAKAAQLSFQSAGTDIMDGIIDLHHDIFSVMLVIAGIVLYLICQLIFKFSARNFKTARNFYFTHHTFLEVLWTLIPMLILVLIIIPSFVLLYGMDEIFDSEITLKVIGRQWYWSYEYSARADVFGLSFHSEAFDSYLITENDLSFGGFRLLEVDNRVRIPSDSQIRVLITSSDVLHSWAIPSLGVKTDACPGRLNQIGLSVYRTGVFYGQCSEICGVNHGFMPIVIESITFSKFISWLSSIDRFFIF